MKAAGSLLGRTRAWLIRSLRPGAGGTGHVVGVLALLGLATYMFLIATFPLSLIAETQGLRQVFAIIGFVLWIGTYIYCTIAILRGNRRKRTIQVLALSGLGWSLLLFGVFGMNWAAPPALSFSIMLLCLSGKARGFATLACFALYIPITANVFHGDDIRRVLEEFALSTLIFYSIPRLVTFARELEDTRAELAGVAVSEQRLRWARDLHDTLGHGLSVVLLKLELVERLSERDPRRAVEELREARSLLRDSIGEMQTVVAGMRDTSLAGEVASARTILTSAGVQTEVKIADLDLNSSTSQALAWIVREGATNVLRHSDSTLCEIRLKAEEGRAVLELASNGPSIMTKRTPSGGHGLRGMRERLADLNGELQASGQTGGGFLLRAQVPLSGSGKPSGIRRMTAAT
ncbi:two-component system, NarL family, sensor histidine kinase DesK [Amycolatopsis xylanica]|uniref:Two-component system, NarL family, sensor histidine kinase DesK n=1 Tax=Amycolatopsis xylanica TaxID=589385 RepID=A0A1H3DGJ1_9PSEU|nr:sensor histidine kinase [Amycolatopsis xylanica]SDX65525.1 two-component system, NarL family, sensor histidine kinase DesK [Amycolatopsis xylanica]